MITTINGNDGNNNKIFFKKNNQNWKIVYEKLLFDIIFTIILNLFW